MHDACTVLFPEYLCYAAGFKVIQDIQVQMPSRTLIYGYEALWRSVGQIIAFERHWFNKCLFTIWELLTSIKESIQSTKLEAVGSNEEGSLGEYEVIHYHMPKSGQVGSTWIFTKEFVLHFALGLSMAH